jgi:hypothetical protein
LFSPFEFILFKFAAFLGYPCQVRRMENASFLHAINAPASFAGASLSSSSPVASGGSANKA